MPKEQSLNVLVIDDTESHASLVSRVAAKAGHRVEAVESAKDALKTARKIGADAILPKPFPLADLRETVAKLLENRRIGGMPLHNRRSGG